MSLVPIDSTPKTKKPVVAVARTIKRGGNSDSIAREISRQGDTFRKALVQAVQERDPDLSRFSNSLLDQAYAMEPWAANLFIKIITSQPTSEGPEEFVLGYDDEDSA